MKHICLSLTQLEQLAGLPTRTHCYQPQADAALGKIVKCGPNLYIVVSISYEFKPGQVRANLRPYIP